MPGRVINFKRVVDKTMVGKMLKRFKKCRHITRQSILELYGPNTNIAVSGKAVSKIQFTAFYETDSHYTVIQLGRGMETAHQYDKMTEKWHTPIVSKLQ